jgi:hypothetical protein
MIDSTEHQIQCCTMSSIQHRSQSIVTWSPVHIWLLLAHV